jgi:hypothetical protein
MAHTEKRTQIYLTSAQHRAAMTLARDRGGSLAGVVREALDRYLAEASHGHEIVWEADPALALIGAIRLPARARRTALTDDVDRLVYQEGPWSSPTAPDSLPPSTRATPPTGKRRTRGDRSPKRAAGSSRRNSS